MKKLIFFCFFSGLLGLSASAQVESKSTDKKTKIETPHSKTKIKKTSTPGQKVHNIIHPKRKHYSGIRVKQKPKKD